MPFPKRSGLRRVPAVGVHHLSRHVRRDDAVDGVADELRRRHDQRERQQDRDGDLRVEPGHNETNQIVREPGGRLSAEVALALPTQQSRVRFSAFLNFSVKILMLPRFIKSGTA